MRVVRALLATAGTTAGLLAATTGAASATGAVANSCAVIAPVVTTTVAPDGLYLHWLNCGQGLGGVTYATVEGHPYSVQEPGRAPFCMANGARYYPNNVGNASTAVLTPTVSCPTTAPGGARVRPI